MVHLKCDAYSHQLVLFFNEMFVFKEELQKGEQIFVYNFSFA